MGYNSVADIIGLSSFL